MKINNIPILAVSCLMIGLASISTADAGNRNRADLGFHHIEVGFNQPNIHHRSHFDFRERYRRRHYDHHGRPYNKHQRRNRHYRKRYSKNYGHNYDRAGYRHFNRPCHSVYKRVYDAHGNPHKIGGTLCYDRHGQGYVVDGSRYQVW